MLQFNRAKMALMGLLLMAAGTSRAGTIEVSPITVEIPAGQMSTTLTIVNHGAGKAAVQLRGFAWSQTTTSDTLVRTDDLVVSPPISQLGPDESQVVRIMLRRPATGTEGSYRLLLDELPASGEPGAVQFALRLSMPIFVTPAGRVAPDLEWHVVNTGSGAELRVINRGTRRDRLMNLTVAIPGGAVIKPVGLQNPYILPGAERRMRLPMERGALRGPQVRVTGSDDLGPINALATVQAAP